MRLKDLLVPGMSSRSILVALGSGVVYLTISVLWIVFSDRLAAELAPGTQELVLIQKYKGLGFVGVMTVLITWLVYVVHQRGAVLERALHLTRTDSTTGLSNRAVAEEYLAGRFASSNGYDWPCGVLLLDIRGLSRINRSIGRSGGDQLLQQVGHRIRQLVRPLDMVARLESDRFVVVFGPLTGEAEAVKIGERIRSVFDNPLTVDGVEVHIELRGGLALARRDGKTPFELLDAAERVLYRSKTSGRGLEVASREDLMTDAGYLEREGRLRRAIREHEFSIALQPQVGLDNFDLVGTEVLARWHNPEQGDVPPAEFIPLSESLGLVEEITAQILDATGSCAAHWIDKELPLIRICVNLSGLDLRSGRILELVESFLNRSRLPGRYLTLEITESWLMEDPNLSLGLVHRLREMGPRIAIDDFGTGYSALSQLVDFPFDYVKFDRRFVAGANRVPKRAKVLMAIQRMAMTLGAKTIAEGVERIDELALLEEMGFDEVQGFLFSKPVTPKQFETRFLSAVQPPFMKIRDKLKKRTAGDRLRATRIGRS